MKIGAAVVLGFVAATAVAGGCTPAASTPKIPTAKPFDGVPQVGALFSGTSDYHFCTATVIHSKSKDLVLTAAHCISGTGQGLRFVPQYDDDNEPFGSWNVERAFAPQSWISHGVPTADMAVLVVAPHTVGTKVVQIETAVGGGDTVGTAPPVGSVVTIPAYAAGSKDKPVSCSVKTYRHKGVPAFDCTPYPDGTSGAPWFSGTQAHGTITGVIGGLFQGGCTPATSYSALFCTNIQGVIAHAASGAATEHLPSPPASGC